MRGIWTVRVVATTVAVLMIGPLLFASARAERMSTRMVRSYPQANDVLDGSMVDIVLGFEVPVDHERSTLTLRSERGDRELRPRLESAPNYLFGTAGRLVPGAYELDWSAWLADGQVRSGKIPFTVDSSRDIGRRGKATH
jgi:methionine-rich copper-binding protein CopC